MHRVGWPAPLPLSADTSDVFVKFCVSILMNGVGDTLMRVISSTCSEKDENKNLEQDWKVRPLLEQRFFFL